MALGSRKDEPQRTPLTPPHADGGEFGAEEMLLGLGNHAPADASFDTPPETVSVTLAPPPSVIEGLTDAASLADAADTTPPTPAPPVRKEPSIFRNRNFMLLWIAQGLTQTAQYALNVTLLLFVADLTNGSSLSTSLVNIAFLVPGVFLSALAGVIVDRYEKRKVLIVTNLLRALTVLPLLVIDRGFPLALALPAILILSVLFSTISQFFGPAEGSMIPLVVSRKQFVIANSLFNITLAAALLLGFAIIGPVLRAVIGDFNLFIGVALIYGLSTVLVLLLPSHLEPEVAEQPKQTWRAYAADIWPELIEGWNFIRRDHLISTAIIYMSMVMAVLFTVAGIGPIFVQKALHLPSSGLALVMAPAGLGLVVGIVLVNRWASRVGPNVMIIGASFVMGATIFVMSLIKPTVEVVMSLFGQPENSYSGLPLLAPIVILSIFLGLGIAFVNIPGQTVLQERSPEDVRGRVFAAFFTFMNLISIFPTLIAGGLSDVIGVTPVMAGVGVVVALMGGYGVLQLRAHRTV